MLLKILESKPRTMEGGRKVGCEMSIPVKMEFKFEVASSAPKTAKQNAKPQDCVCLASELLTAGVIFEVIEVISHL